MAPDFIIPDWPAPARVRALQTTRRGGASGGPYAGLNLGDHVGDDPDRVVENRASVGKAIGALPVWLEQVHGTDVVDVADVGGDARADAALARTSGRACVVMTADCLPVLLCDREGTVVAAVHAGWRGLCAGVIERSVAAMAVPGSELLAWLGPAIGPSAFEVGGEVRAAFLAADERAAAAFTPGAAGKWFADIYRLARLRLARAGVSAVFGGGLCTVSDAERFFSYRRNGVTGRMGSFIWLECERV